MMLVGTGSYSVLGRWVCALLLFLGNASTIPEFRVDRNRNLSNSEAQDKQSPYVFVNSKFSFDTPDQQSD